MEKGFTQKGFLVASDITAKFLRLLLDVGGPILMAK